MTTRAGELLSATDQLAGACGELVDLELVRQIAVTAGWGTRSITEPLLPSGVSHGVPWGLSIAIERQALELRLFVESQAEPASLTAFAGMYGAELTRIRAMLDGLPPMRVWHAVALAPAIRWHAYLCVPDHAVALETLRRAGVEPPPLRERDRISMVSLDLTSALRVKAYVLMPDASLDDLAAHSADGYQFGRAMLGDARRIWWLAAHAVTESSRSCALHFGVPRHVDQPTATHRVRELLRSLELPLEPWERARGDHHFVSFQRRDGAPRVTTYFLPQVQR